MRRMIPLNTAKVGGFSLLEVLIAVVILAVGLLGLGALQSVSFRNNHSAYMRSQAVIMAYDMMDKLRVDHDQALAGAYNLAMASSPGSGTGFAAGQLSAWIADLGGLLPSGDGAVNCTNATELCQVSVQWDDSHGSNGSTTQQVQVTARL